MSASVPLKAPCSGPGELQMPVRRPVPVGAPQDEASSRSGALTVARTPLASHCTTPPRQNDPLRMGVAVRVQLPAAMVSRTFGPGGGPLMLSVSSKLPGRSPTACPEKATDASGNGGKQVGPAGTSTCTIWSVKATCAETGLMPRLPARTPTPSTRDIHLMTLPPLTRSRGDISAQTRSPLLPPVYDTLTPCLPGARAASTK